MRLPDSTEIVSIVSLRKLADRLAQISQKGGSVRLSPEDVEVALSALKLHARTASPSKLKVSPRIYQIELLSDQGWPQATLALLREEKLAHVAFREAVNRHPGKRIRVRLGARILLSNE
jgi:hypothetical protein